MTKTQSISFFLLLIFIAFSCSNDKDNRIIMDMYNQNLSDLRYAIVENSGGNPKTQQIVPLFDTIIKQVEATGTISEGVRKTICTHVEQYPVLKTQFGI